MEFGRNAEGLSQAEEGNKKQPPAMKGKQHYSMRYWQGIEKEVALKFEKITCSSIVVDSGPILACREKVMAIKFALRVLLNLVSSDVQKEACKWGGNVTVDLALNPNSGIASKVRTSR